MLSKVLQAYNNHNLPSLKLVMAVSEVDNIGSGTQVASH